MAKDVIVQRARRGFGFFNRSTSRARYRHSLKPALQSQRSVRHLVNLYLGGHATRVDASAPRFRTIKSWPNGMARPLAIKVLRNLSQHKLLHPWIPHFVISKHGWYPDHRTASLINIVIKCELRILSAVWIIVQEPHVELGSGRNTEWGARCCAPELTARGNGKLRVWGSERRCYDSSESACRADYSTRPSFVVEGTITI